MPWVAHPEGLSNATELVSLVRELGDFCVGVGAFVDPHPENGDPDLDASILADKARVGASFALTQLFFTVADYFALVERVRALGCGLPIIPGIMPITSAAQIRRITGMCGSCIPDRLQRELELRADDPDAATDFGVAYATLQCADLLANGAPGIHFYTLNRSPATRAILSALRTLSPWEAQPGFSMSSA